MGWIPRELKGPKQRFPQPRPALRRELRLRRLWVRSHDAGGHGPVCCLRHRNLLDITGSAYRGAVPATCTCSIQSFIWREGDTGPERQTHKDNKREIETAGQPDRTDRGRAVSLLSKQMRQDSFKIYTFALCFAAIYKRSHLPINSVRKAVKLVAEGSGQIRFPVQHSRLVSLAWTRDPQAP